MDKNAVISGCIKVEKSVASLYGKLMKIFPDKKDFWKDLFNDETEHLAFLRDVKSLGQTDELKTIELPPSLPIINETLKMAGTTTEKISKGSVSLKNSLKMMLQLEESLVETYTNKVIAHLMSCDNEPSYKKILADEKKHVNKIKKMMKLQ